MSITAKNVANYFLMINDPDVGELISNLKVQKLVYYAQGFYLAIYDKTLFKDPIEAWEHGPVVRELYNHFKKYESNHIPPPVDFDYKKIFNKKQIKVLQEVYNVYGQYSAWKLRQLTHSEPPWQKTARNEEISIPLMKKYFKTQLLD